MIATEDSVDILPAEGESGAESVGFSMFGNARHNEFQKIRARPTNTLVLFNFTTLAAQVGYPVPAAYRGNFATLFDGTIIAGTRLDNVGVGWANSMASAFRCYADGTGGTCVNPAFANYTPPQYTYNTVGAKAGLAGIDIFFRTSMTSVNAWIDFLDFPFVLRSAQVILNNVPQFGSFFGGTVVSKRRPEGYFTGENGVQVFFQPLVAATAIPAGFVDPTSVGVPKNASVDGGINRLRMNLVP